MSVSKEWQWEIVNEDQREFWRNPSEESYWLLNRWKGQGNRIFWIWAAAWEGIPSCSAKTAFMYTAMI
jgi:hypothetical protein